MSLGPRNRYDRPLQQKTEYLDQKERDSRLEETWSYERDGTMSTLAFVAAHHKPLVAEFMDWYSTAHVEGESKEQAVAIWERVRFGNALDRASHGVLTFAVLDAFFPERHGKKPTKRAEPKPVPADHSMPALRLGHKEIDRRLMELERQRRELEGQK